MAPPLANLPDRDLRAALCALRDLAEQSSDSASFVEATLEELTSIVASDLTTLSICDLRGGTRRVIGRKAETLSEADRAAFDRHFREHPLVRFHSSHPGGPTQRISDCIDVCAFHNSALHADYYRRIGINYVMALPLHIDSASVISVVFNRSHADFEDRERGLLDAVRGPISAIYRNLVACEEAGVGLKRVSQIAANSGWETLKVTLAGQIVDTSPKALRLLDRFFPGHAIGRQSQLPAMLYAWMANSRNWGLERSAIRFGEQFSLSRLGSRLTVYLIVDPENASGAYLLMKCTRVEVRPAELAGLPLTEREREVLALVAAGKTNGEIATILAISARTVQKHLEHVFQKLGVETRTAAAVLALAAPEDHARIVQ